MDGIERARVKVSEGQRHSDEQARNFGKHWTQTLHFSCNSKTTIDESINMQPRQLLYQQGLLYG